MPHDRLLRECQKNIVERDLFATGERILVALSGGGDSTALLDLMVRLASHWQWRLAAVHFDHGLRPESRQEAEIVQTQVSRRYGLRFFLEQLCVRRLAESKGWSLEMAGREARYGKMLQIAREGGYTSIALGHQKNDLVETVFMRLLRGSGTEGLTGIRWKRALEERAVVRPLLSVSGDQLRQYCKERALDFLKDPSNEDMTILRNRVRHHLIPLLKKQYDDRLEQHVWQLAQVVQDESDWLQAASRQWEAEVCRYEPYPGRNRSSTCARLNRSAFVQLPIAGQRRVLRNVWHKLMPGTPPLPWPRIESIRRLAAEGSTGNAIDLPRGWRSSVSYESLLIHEKLNLEESARSYEYKLEIPGEIRVPEASCVIYARYCEAGHVERELLQRDAGTGCQIYLNAAMLQTNCFLIRNRRPGDRFRPLGAPGIMKLKDFFINEKIEKHHRAFWPLVLEGGRLLWVVGLRLSESARLPDEPVKRLVEVGVRWL